MERCQMVVTEWEACKGGTTTTQTKSMRKRVAMCKKMEDETLGGQKLKGIWKSHV